MPAMSATTMASCTQQPKPTKAIGLVQFYPRGDRTLSPIPPPLSTSIVDKKTYLAVQCQLPADNTVVDPFALYPYFPAKLYSSQLSPTLELVQLDWIFSHYVGGTLVVTTQ